MEKALVCTVVSYVPFDIVEEKPGLTPGRFFIPKSDGTIPSLLIVERATHYVYLDETRGSLPVRNPPDEVARSIVDDYVSAQLGISEVARPAMFWVAGEWSAENLQKQFVKEIALAKMRQKAWFLACCKIADDDWTRYHKHNVISDSQRLMAEMLGWTPEQHEWLGVAMSQQSEFCPACSTPVRPGIVVCPTCRCILDKKKHQELTFA